MIDYESARQQILEWMSETLQVPVDQIPLDKPFADIGLDSLDAVHMIATIESIIRQELPEDIMRRANCLSAIFEMMKQRMAAA